MAETKKKNSSRTPMWNNWRSPITLGVFILLVSAAIWFLANAQAIVVNLPK